MMIQICLLYTELRLSYQEISNQLNLSTGSISKYISLAQSEGFLTKPSFCIPEKYNGFDYSELTDHFLVNYRLASKIQEQFKDTPLRNVTVTISGEETVTSLRALSANVARFLETNIKEQFVGINWGPSVSRVIEELNPENLITNLRVTPVFASLGLSQDNENYLQSLEYESNRNAQLFAQKFGAKHTPIRLEFPAFIRYLPPQKIKKGYTDTIRTYLESEETFKRVFGKDGYIDHIDTLISGAGSLGDEETPMGAWLKYTTLYDRRSNLVKRLRSEQIVGDLAQSFLTINGVNDKSLRKYATDFNERVMGLRPKHFVDLAKRNQDYNKGLGTVIVGAGSHKSAIIIAALESSAVNHLFIDEHLGNGIIDHYKKQ